MNSIIIGDLEDMTVKNNAFRHVVSTTNEMQLVLMSLNQNEDIGVEIHNNTTQFIRIESGKAICSIGRTPNENKNFKDVIVEAGAFFLIPSGYYHNIKNIGTDQLKIYTIYAPPHHPHGKIQYFKQKYFVAHIYSNRKIVAFGVPDDSPYMVKCFAITSGNTDTEQKTIFYDYEPPIKSDSGLFGPFFTAEIRYIDIVIVPSPPVIATSLLIDPSICMTANLHLVDSLENGVTLKNYRIKPSEEITYLYWIDKPGRQCFKVEPLTATGDPIKSSIESGWHLMVCGTHLKIEEVFEMDMQPGINSVPIVIYHFGKYALDASNNMLYNQ